jgi:hypothetical protein
MICSSDRADCMEEVVRDRSGANSKQHCEVGLSDMSGLGQTVVKGDLHGNHRELQRAFTEVHDLDGSSQLATV